MEPFSDDISMGIVENEASLSSSSSSCSESKTMEMLNKALGNFYFEAHNHCPPTFLQIVGWTRGAEKKDTKRLYVYVRKVPLLIKNSPTGGFWYIDHDLVNNYYKEITVPIHSSKSPLVSGNAIIIPGGKFLRYSGVTVPIYTRV